MLQAKTAKETQNMTPAAQREAPEKSGACPSFVQAKLTIGAPNDIYEKEADDAAERVMRMPQREALSPFGGSGIQRQCANCDEEDKQHAQTKPLIQRQAKEDEELQTKPLASRLTPFVQRKSDGGGVASEGLTSRINASRGSGSPLPDNTRSFMESRIGADFSGVRVHTGGEAVQMNRELNAQAFTVGRDVYFGEGRYSPESSAGKGLLAHELAHVVQQGNQAGIQRKVKDTECMVHAYDNSNPKDSAVIPEETENGTIGVSSVDNMVTEVNRYINNPENSCKCVKRLEINGHGTDGYQSVGNGNQYVNDNKALVHDSKDAHLDKLKNIKFCPSGLLLLMGCHTGRGNGITLLKKISKRLPGIVIVGSQHFTFGAGMGNKKIYGEGDTYNYFFGTPDPFLKSPYINWHLTINGKEFIHTGADEKSSDLESKLKVAEHVKVKTPDGQLIKIK